MAKRKKRKSKLSSKEKELRSTQRRFRACIVSLFKTAGFTPISTRGIEINFSGMKSEFDNIFVRDNIIVVAEDTCASSSSDIRDHLLKKSIFYNHILTNHDSFVEFIEKQFPDFRSAKKPEYQAADFKIIITYCSKHRLEDDHKTPFPMVIFLEDRHLQYFRALAKSLGKTVSFEVFKFLGLQTSDVGLRTGTGSRTYSGFILPESPSGFPRGYKVVTFYVDPDTVMSLSYVLRRDGWIDADGLYQRMISGGKIRSMRQYLAQDERVFINNIIVSLPHATKILNESRQQLDLKDITKTTPIIVEIPEEFNTIGIIDGQHRVFAYHEGNDIFDAQIAPKRKKQQLLVTGVVYPDKIDVNKQREFEARLFLEINDKQTRTKAELRQAISTIVDPFSIIAISKAIVNKLAANGPLCGVLEAHIFDKGKLKTSSIVSYAMRHVVKCDGNDSLFKLWKHTDKTVFASYVNNATQGARVAITTEAQEALQNYIDFCAKEINSLLIGYKIEITRRNIWILDRKQSRALTTTAINGLIFCLRSLVENDKVVDLDGYKKAFTRLNVDFSPKKFKYKSSHWKDLGDKIYQECFS